MIEIRAVPVPNGFAATPSGQRLRVGLALAFRAEAGWTDLPPALRDWPNTLKSSAVTFRIHLTDAAGAPMPVTLHARLDLLDTVLWSRIITRDRRWQAHSPTPDPGTPQ